MENTEEKNLDFNNEKENWTSGKNIFLKTSIALFLIFSMVNSILIYNFIVTLGTIIR
ncbi:MAG: hypothetical protein IJV31_03250 [Clostridia bacterium]|nr:hypothetical protein [Clostridia bacterium]